MDGLAISSSESLEDPLSLPASALAAGVAATDFFSCTNNVRIMSSLDSILSAMISALEVLGWKNVSS